MVEHEHNRKVDGVSFSPDGKLILTYGSDDSGQIGGAVVWDTISGEPVKTFAGNSDREISAGAFAPNGATLAIATHAGIAEIWNLIDDKPAKSAPM